MEDFKMRYLSWADGFTQLAGNASFLTRWITPQCMLTTEPGTQGPFFKWIVDCCWLF